MVGCVAYVGYAGAILGALVASTRRKRGEGRLACLTHRLLTRIIHEADIVCHNINGCQNLWLYYPQHRVLKPEAQAKESAQFSSLARRA